MIAANEIDAAERRWADAVVEMGRCHQQQPQRLSAVATQLLTEVYDFEAGVLFKPTLATGPYHFRRSLSQTLSYFIGGEIPGDMGFARKPWQAVRFLSHGRIWLGSGESVVSGGVYEFQDPAGQITRAEFTFVYHLTAQPGSIKILAHHSSLPCKV